MVAVEVVNGSLKAVIKVLSLSCVFSFLSGSAVKGGLHVYIRLDTPCSSTLRS